MYDDGAPRHHRTERQALMRLSLALLPALAGFAALALPADALPRPGSGPSPFSVTLACRVAVVPREAPTQKGRGVYGVSVINTLDHPLGAGTAILYGVTFPDGSTQNATTSLYATVGSGASETVGDLSPGLTPTSCTAGIPASPPYSPVNGSGGGPISKSRPVVDPI
jgi:hypothetical protein